MRSIFPVRSTLLKESRVVLTTATAIKTQALNG
jgi:hypothetical protein